jgi:uncharacterized repeat protein (TIGR01451 family)
MFVNFRARPDSGGSAIRIGLALVLSFTAVSLVLGQTISPAPAPVLRYATGWGSDQEPRALAAFEGWAQQYIAQPTQPAKAQIASQGTDLAKARRAALVQLMQFDPAKALASAVPAVIRDQLPAAVVEQLETRVSGIGELEVSILCPAKNGPLVSGFERYATINGVKYRAYVYGRRSGQGGKMGIPLQGIAVDGVIALHESALREFEPGETAGTKTIVTVGNQSGQNILAEAGGQIYQFGSLDALNAAETRLETAEAGISPTPKGSASEIILSSSFGKDGGGGTAGDPPTAWTTGLKSNLVIRVDFSDLPGDPSGFGFTGTQVFCQSLMDTEVSPYYIESSYGLTWMTNAVSTNLYRLPQTAVFYATDPNGNSQLHTDAENAAKADYNLNDYDRIIVVFSNLGNIPNSLITYGGLANIVGKNIWVNGDIEFRVLAHELGHTYGLFHAGLWQVTDGNPISPNGTAIEYGDDYDTMGANFANDHNVDFNMYYKNRLGWLSDSRVLTAGTNGGTFTTFAFDWANNANATNHQILAVKFKKDNQRTYWMGIRRNFPGNASMFHGTYVIWGLNQPGALGGSSQSELLDMNTPGNSLTDAALSLGSLFNDASANFFLRPLDEAGPFPDRSMRLQINNGGAPSLVVTTNYLTGGNGNNVVDPDECNGLYIVLTNNGFANASNVTAVLSTRTPGVILSQRTSAYPDLPVGGGGTNFTAFGISTAPGFLCGSPVVLTMVVKSDQGNTTNRVVLQSGTNAAPLRFDTTLAVGIPDANLTGVDSPIVVSNLPGAVANVSVSLYITHTFDADLSLELVSPDGTRALLSGNNGFSGQNYGIGCFPESARTTFSDAATTPIGAGNPPYLGSYKPDASLAVFNGKSGTNVNGTWKLHAVDSAGFDVGTIQCWSLFVSPPICIDGGGQCPGVDLSIGMVAAPEPVFVGSNLVYTIHVTNAGPDSAKSAVISQLLPASVVFVSASVSQGSIGQAGGVITANLGNMLPGAVVVATVVVTPTTPDVISSTVSINSNNPDFDLSNNSAFVVSHVNPPFADLAVGIDSAPNPVLVNQVLTYTVSVTNRGPSAASGTVVSNLLPASVGILNVTPSQGFATAAGNVVTLNLGTIPSGGRATATINVNPTLEGTIVASASAVANQIDPVLENNSASVSTVVGPATDLALGLTATPNPVVLRSNVTYTISVTNRGPSVASSVVVSDILPAGITLVSSNTTAGSISVSGTTITCGIGAMTNGATATITLVIRTSAAGTLVDSASISGAQSDPDTSNNSASVNTTVAAPFVSILASGATLTAESLTPPNGTVDVGETVTLQLRLRNAGNVANSNLVATLLAANGVTAPGGPQTYGILAPSGFPVGKSFTFTASGTNGGVVQATLALQDISGAVTNNLGTVTFNFSLPAVTSFSNTNRIDIPTTLQDQQLAGPGAPYPSPITVTGVSGLVGKVTATLNNLTHSFPHDINLLLVGPGGNAAILMSDAADASSVSGADVTFDDSAEGALPGSGQILSGTYRPSAFDLSPAFTNPAPIGPYATTLSVFNGPTPNGAWSLFANDDSDGDFGNIAGGWTLSVTTVSPVNQVADLSVSSVSTAATVLVGSLLTNTFALTNNGPNGVATAAFTNTIPGNATLVSATVSQGSIITNGNTLLFNVGALPAGSNAIVRIVLIPTSAGSISNTGAIASASGEVDLNLANNSVTALATAVLPQTDISVAASATPNPVTTGSNFTASITVTNLGTNSALNVVVSNTLPAGVTFVSASASQGSAANVSGTVVGTLGTIPAAGSATLNFTVTATAAGAVTNVARASTLSVDGNSANDSATLVVSVANAAPVILASGANLVQESIVPANAAIDPGETVTVSLTLTNAGQVDAANLVATLLAANGVNSPSGPATYGTLVHGGATVSRSFSFTSQSASGTGVVATLHLQDGANDLGTVDFVFAFPSIASFTNPVAIVIPDHGPATPYPSTISVAGLTGIVSKVAIGLNGLTHSFPHDVSILLAGPSGQKVTALAHVGGGHAVTNLNITLADTALLTLSESGGLSSGEFKPASFPPAATFPAPAPAGVPAATLSAFNGSAPNGGWSLFVLDDSVGDAGSISGGWTLAVTTVNPVSPVVNLIATVSGTPNPVNVGSLLTYRLTLTNIGPNTATGILFTDNLPPGVTLVSSNTTSGSFSLVGGAVNINVGSLAPGAGLLATLGVVPSLAGTLENIATATSAQTDIDPVSNTAKVLTTAIAPTPARLSISASANGQYEITVTADPGQAYTVQGATNFVNWVPVFTGTAAANGTFKFNTTNAQTFNYRFFRSVRLP